MGSSSRKLLAIAAGVAASVALAVPALALAPGGAQRLPGAPGAPGAGQGFVEGPEGGQEGAFRATVAAIERLAYQPAYLPVGTDKAFAPAVVPNDLPAEDYTTGSIPGSPDDPSYPPIFHRVLLHSPDGAPFFGELAMHAGRRPAVLVVPGFNTHQLDSVVRWAALLAWDGYDVLAADQRDSYYEYSAGYGYPHYPQTFGWKEAQDVLAAGQYLRSQPGVTSVGVVGFSEGAQDTVLAMAQDREHVFSAGLTFSGPADQDTQIYSTAVPPDCSSPACTYPATDALVALVVPPYTYTDVCSALNYAASYYHTTGFDIMARESAFHAQTSIRVPLLNFYAADDPLVKPFQAQMMAGYEAGNPLQQTLEIDHGGHAYYFDRWWQQEAILTYFKRELPGAQADRAIGTTPSVNETPGGAPLADQLVSLGHPTRQSADAELAPYVCDTSAGSPGASSDQPSPSAGAAREVSADYRPAGEPVCGPSRAPADQPTLGRSEGPPAPRYFASDFPVIPDDLWGYPIGGFGGIRRDAPLHHTPVIFVHGNQADAQNWLDVMAQFERDAGYSMQEMYALSYNGLENYYAGAPVDEPPTSADLAYLKQNPQALANGGHGSADDDEVPDLCRFFEAVQWYTGSRQVDIVAHSLGVTIAREFMAEYPALAADVVAFVGIAGANHGTTVCRGLQSTYYGCNEISPGSPWLAALNGPGGDRETYGPTHWLTVYNGSVGDPYFDPPLDQNSPALRGALNLTFPGTYHNDLRVDPPEVDSYLEFLLDFGQAGPGADRLGPRTAAQLRKAPPLGWGALLCGVPRLLSCKSGGSTRPPGSPQAGEPS